MIQRAALLTDLYELTMMQGYHRYGLHHGAVFDMFFRRQPFGGGFSVFAGLDDLLSTIENLRFEADDIAYLESLQLFDDAFLEYLSNFRFSGDIWAVPEGTLVFPQEPLMRVHTSILEAQLIESMLLNTINFQTLVATKTARIYLASEEGSIAEFGLRRAQGVDGALSAARAAYIGGAASTSNTLAGKQFGIPVTGTMAHSWVMAFASEREAFERYAELYPDKTILLIDTYDTLGSGVENAIAVGTELQKQGKRLGVRLDSGDIQYLSKQVRRRLDKAGLRDALITVSNELDEQIVHQLVSANSPVDLWGVGTQLVTGGGDPSLTGVYKLCAKEDPGGTYQPTMKVSDNPEKSTNPGIKQVYRFYGKNKYPIADLIALEEQPPDGNGPINFYHPSGDYRSFRLDSYHSFEPLLQRHMQGGKRVIPSPALPEIREQTLANLQCLDETYKRIINPHIYKVSVSKGLRQLKQGFLAGYLADADGDADGDGGTEGGGAAPPPAESGVDR
ncbi:MAG: nicotinate phosphoribosyltransferase [Spirochaeta sp.]|jgi:nicotinate phosphoribosyltransferase|nr:nicotinate phosphoribosyltransferase [Spirochaeta sp.]